MSNRHDLRVAVKWVLIGPRDVGGNEFCMVSSGDPGGARIDVCGWHPRGCVKRCAWRP